MSKVQPILFSSPMVRALLEGRKTQTRRILKLPHENPLGQWEPTTIGGKGVFFRDGSPAPERAAIWHTRTGDCIVPRFTPGDRLYVRESIIWDAEACNFYYQADNAGAGEAVFNLLRKRASVPSIHMPRAASRLTLVVTDVRVERLQDISEEDAAAEGARSVYGEPFDKEGNSLTDRRRFELLWRSINGDEAWTSNPWIVAVSFSVHKLNVDALKLV